MAFLDDIYVVCAPERVADIHASLQVELWRHARISVHQGKTQLWNRAGVVPSGTEALTAAARVEDEDAIVWRGDPELPEVEQGIRLLGTPLGHPVFVEDQLARLTTSHRVLLERIQLVNDLQVAWLILVFCAATRANYVLRVVHPQRARTFAERHDAEVWGCLQRLLGIDGDPLTEDLARLPLSMGGLGLRSAVRTSPAAHWASWADSLPMIQKRHPAVARLIVAQLSGSAEGPHLSGATVSRERLLDVSYVAPTWIQIADGLRPNRPEGDGEPGVPRHGWQFFASQAVEDCFFRHGFAPRLTDTQQAMVRSQSGPMAGVPLLAFPTSPLFRFDASAFRALLLRRLWRPLPLSSSACRCGRPLDAFGHHRSACAVSGVLGRRGFALESAAARVCREAGGRVTLNVRVSDLDLPPRGAQDQRRLEVVADGLPLFHGAQLAIDTTMVSAVRGDGQPGPLCARVDGAALARARRRKEITYPELSGANGRARLVVLACEVGGRWSEESMSFLSQLAKAKVRHEPPAIRASARHAWLRRWSSILACSASRSFASSLLELRGGLGADGPTPSSSEVVTDDRFSGW